MLDFAAFVAAAIRDATVMELLKENQNLRTQLNQTRLVSVTGPGRTPVYASGERNIAR